VWLLVTGVFVIAYWRFIDVEPPIKFYQSFGVDLKEQKQPAFHAGDTMYAYREFEYTRSVPGRVRMQIINVDSGRIAVQFKDAEEHFKIGTYKRSFAVPIPKDLPPGNYNYSVHISYVLNPVSLPVEVVLPPIYFTIIPEKGRE